MTRTATTLRRVRSHLFARHRRGYAGIVGVAAVTGAIVAASLNALQVAGAAHRSTGVPYQAVQWNVLIDLMASFNGLVVGMGALTAAVLLASVASFALEPRIPELARLSLVGMTRMDLLRLTVGELVAAVLAGTALGAALGVPASFGLLAAERASAMTPQGLEPRLMPASFLAAALVTMVAGLVGGLLPVLRVAGTRPLDAQELRRSARRRGRWRGAVSVLLLVLVLLLALAPESAIPSDVAIVLLIPAVTVLVVLNGRIFLAAVTRLLRLLPGARRRPRAIVALSNAASGGARALTATQSIVLALGLLVPLAMVMATGRLIFTIEASRPLASSSIISFGAPPSSEQVEGLRGRVGPERVVPYALVSDVVSAADPYAADQPTLVATDLAALPSQVETSFEQGDAESVGGASAASASERYAVGDTVDLIRRDGGTMRVTVVAKIASNQYLSSDLILDYDDNADLVAQDTVFRCFATAGRDDLRAALEAEGIGSATVMSRQGWVDEGIRGALAGQRQVLTMIFLVPCLLALAATALGVRVYAKVTQRSRRRMRLLGFTESDMRAEYLGEMLVQLTVIVAELVVVIGLSAWKVGRMAAAAGTDSPPVLDTTVTAVAGLVMLAALITAHLVHLHLILKEGRAHETL